MEKLTLAGKDNYGKQRQEFADKLADLTDDEFLKVAQHYIWLSGYAFNNDRSDYHWMADACYDHAAINGKTELYEQAQDLAVNS